MLKKPFLTQYLVLFFALYIFCIFFTTPKFASIDPDYHFAMISISNHGSPDVTSMDVLALRSLLQDNLGAECANEILPPYCHFQSPSGKYYGFHFWLWPLLCVPAFKFLPLLGISPFRAHEITLYFIFLFTHALPTK